MNLAGSTQDRVRDQLSCLALYTHDEAEGVCAAEEADCVAADLVVEREGAQAEEEYDRAAVEKSSDPGSDALFHHATIGANS
ncbi:hypothetical protein KIN20_013010 [Parelaphostrongylus tenuis]|uniref:Uncharacterized protein n=1 Tax=Parelaphostrongylus tenuis TaxID=148309 RepID=A0AAD5N1M4_PARTN|nr:hypothetical protein KIN20_013010 [Parelaphostrongylus tenuis]